MRIAKYLIVLIMFGSTIVSGNDYTLKFNNDSLDINESDDSYFYQSYQSFQLENGAKLSYTKLYLKLSEAKDITKISSGSESSEVGFLLSDASFSDSATSESNAYQTVESYSSKSGYGSKAIQINGTVKYGNNIYAELLVFPITLSETGSLLFHRNINIFIHTRQVSANELITNINFINNTTLNLSPTFGAIEYLIVTSSQLSEPMEELKNYKTSTGILTEVVLIEDILINYSGRDDAEKLRNALKEFYNNGGHSVLLVGDETILPVRYAYPLSTNLTPSIEYQQLCDLYFADMTGDWDVDNDGVWGEVIHDNPDIIPELRVGRLPFNTVTECKNYVRKLITYETDPGWGNKGYLNRAYFFSSDQMRDYDGGQHTLISTAYPQQIEIDTVTGVEASTGSDLAPSNLDAAQLVDILSNGQGFINIIAHGRSDGFAVRTSGYNNWPKSYFLADAENTGHGTFDSLKQNGKVGFYYSLACDNGGFDMDQSPFNIPNPNLAQKLLGLKDAGAVAFVAYSRWGWIKTSHLLQTSFYDSLFAHPEKPAIDAMYASKSAYSYYRDLIYGQLFFGDPTLKIYTDLPKPVDINYKKTETGIDINISSSASPISMGKVIISDGQDIIAIGITDQDGFVEISEGLENVNDFIITVVKDGYLTKQTTSSTSIVTAVEDETEIMPASYELKQNYPNPFNPSTTISFEIDRKSKLKLSIYNILGQNIITLTDETYSPGTYDIEWRGQDSNSNPVASGIYLYKLETEYFSEIKKMVLLK